MGRREYRLCDLGIAAFGYLRKKQRKPKRRKYCRYGDRLSVVSDDGRDRGTGSVYEFPAIEEDNYELKIIFKHILMLQKHNIMLDDAHFHDIIIITEGHFALHVLRAGT